MNIFFNIKYFDESDKMLYLSAVLTLPLQATTAVDAGISR